jgi:hypothetical protein
MALRPAGEPCVASRQQFNGRGAHDELAPTAERALAGFSSQQVDDVVLLMSVDR